RIPLLDRQRTPGGLYRKRSFVTAKKRRGNLRNIRSHVLLFQPFPPANLERRDTWDQFPQRLCRNPQHGCQFAESICGSSQRTCLCVAPHNTSTGVLRILELPCSKRQQPKNSRPCFSENRLSLRDFSCQSRFSGSHRFRANVDQSAEKVVWRYLGNSRHMFNGGFLRSEIAGQVRFRELAESRILRRGSPQSVHRGLERLNRAAGFGIAGNLHTGSPFLLKRRILLSDQQAQRGVVQAILQRDKRPHLAELGDPYIRIIRPLIAENHHGTHAERVSPRIQQPVLLDVPVISGRNPERPHTLSVHDVPHVAHKPEFVLHPGPRTTDRVVRIFRIRILLNHIHGQRGIHACHGARITGPHHHVPVSVRQRGPVHMHLARQHPIRYPIFPHVEVIGMLVITVALDIEVLRHRGDDQRKPVPNSLLAKPRKLALVGARHVRRIVETPHIPAHAVQRLFLISARLQRVRQPLLRSHWTASFHYPNPNRIPGCPSSLPRFRSDKRPRSIAIRRASRANTMATAASTFRSDSRDSFPRPTPNAFGRRRAFLTWRISRTSLAIVNVRSSIAALVDSAARVKSRSRPRISNATECLAEARTASRSLYCSAHVSTYDCQYATSAKNATTSQRSNAARTASVTSSVGTDHP